jgi:hypothetical protein
MRKLSLILVGAVALAAGSVAAAQAAPSGQVQLSCSTYSKVRSRNETYLLQLDLAKKSGSLARDGEAASVVPVISNTTTIAVFFKADGGQYIYYIARDSAKMTASFAANGAINRDQVVGACNIAQGSAL